MSINFIPAQEALDALLERFDLTDVTDVNIAHGQAAIRRRGRSIPTNVEVEDHEIAEIASMLASALDLELNKHNPTLEKRMPPRWRLSFSHWSITQSGLWAMSVRLLPTQVIPLDSYVESGAMPADVSSRLQELLATRKTILVSGGTGAGKTTLLRALVGELPVSERLVIVEDAAELNITRENMDALEANDDCSFEHLVKHTLRKDPDRVIVGEVRGKEALDMVDAANTGHEGMLTTIHSNGREKAFRRLVRLCRRADPNFDIAELDDAISAVVQITLHADRRVIELWEPPAN